MFKQNCFIILLYSAYAGCSHFLHTALEREGLRVVCELALPPLIITQYSIA